MWGMHNPKTQPDLYLGAHTQPPMMINGKYKTSFTYSLWISSETWSSTPIRLQNVSWGSGIVWKKERNRRGANEVEVVALGEWVLGMRDLPLFTPAVRSSSSSSLRLFLGEFQTWSNQEDKKLEELGFVEELFGFFLLDAVGHSRICECAS
jgi:hypothetical protein